MWACYAFNDFHVRVIQKWVDPYGKPMIRIADLADPERAMGWRSRRSCRPLRRSRRPTNPSPSDPPPASLPMIDEPSPLTDVQRRTVIASVIGNAMEWYDFFLYGNAAALVFARCSSRRRRTRSPPR